MGQAGAVVVALMRDEDLRLALKTPKGRRMYDAVLVTLKRAALRLGWLRNDPTARIVRIGRIGRAFAAGGDEDCHG